MHIKQITIEYNKVKSSAVTDSVPAAICFRTKTACGRWNILSLLPSPLRDYIVNKVYAGTSCKIISITSNLLTKCYQQSLTLTANALAFFGEVSNSRQWENQIHDERSSEAPRHTQIVHHILGWYCQNKTIDLTFIALWLLRDLACVVLIGQLLCALIGASRSAFDAEFVRHCSAFL